jgi:hypothetical protein
MEITESEKFYQWDYPVPDGRTVLQGHTDVCTKFGHATYVKDGVDQGYCPRCGLPYALPQAEIEEEAVRLQLAVCVALAPDAGVAGDLQALATALDRAGETPAKQIELLAVAMLDGVRFGNWPKQFKE